MAMGSVTRGQSDAHTKMRLPGDIGAMIVPRRVAVSKSLSLRLQLLVADTKTRCHHRPIAGLDPHLLRLIVLAFHRPHHHHYNDETRSLRQDGNPEVVAVLRPSRLRGGSTIEMTPLRVDRIRHLLADDTKGKTAARHLESETSIQRVRLRDDPREAKKIVLLGGRRVQLLSRKSSRKDEGGSLMRTRRSRHPSRSLRSGTKRSGSWKDR